MQRGRKYESSEAYHFPHGSRRPRLIGAFTLAPSTLAVAFGLVPNPSVPRSKRKPRFLRVAVSLLMLIFVTYGAGCRQRRGERSAQEQAQPSAWSKLRLEIPTTDHPVPMPGAASSGSLRLAIKDGTVYLGSESLPSELIGPRIKDGFTIDPTTTAYLWADRFASCGDLSSVLEELRLAGIGRVGLITEQQIEHGSQDTTGNSVPMGEEVLIAGPPPRAMRSPEEYKEFSDGRLVAPPFSPRVCKAGSPIVLRIDREHAEIGLRVCGEDETWDRLPGKLRGILPGSSQGIQSAGAIFILIGRNKGVNIGYVARTIDISHSAGAEKVGLVIEW